MKSILRIFAAICLCADSSSYASVRVDLDDRPPEEVVKKSLALAEQNLYSKATVAIWVNDQSLASGIALDPYTILTAAHTQFLRDAKKIAIVSNPNAQDRIQDCYYAELADPKAIIHETFMLNPAPDDQLKHGIYHDDEHGFTMFNKPLSQAENTSYAEFNKGLLMAFSPYFGTDLAIIKLKKPLPEATAFPEILSNKDPIENVYGVAMGFGLLKLNNQEMGPITVYATPELQVQRHLFSVKVNSFHCQEAFTKSETYQLYSSFKGLLLNGSESFIPTPNMMKTEALPVGGDSGGPLFIKIAECYKLVGIMSGTRTFCMDPISASQVPDELKSYKQPIYPNWVDVRYFLEWIQQNMGPTK